MLRIFIAVLALCLGGACSTLSPQERLAASQTQCDAYGFKRGTDNYAACLFQLDQIAKERDAAKQQQFVAGLQAMADRNRSITCDTFTTGGGGPFPKTSTTTCR